MNIQKIIVIQGRYQGGVQYSTSIRTTQPEDTLKQISADVPKGEKGKKIVVNVTVIEITPDMPGQSQ